MSKNFITIFSNITSLLISRDEARKEELKKLEEAKKEAEGRRRTIRYMVIVGRMII